MVCFLSLEMYRDWSMHWNLFLMMELNCRCYITLVNFYRRLNNKHLTELQQEWSPGRWTVCEEFCFAFITYLYIYKTQLALQVERHLDFKAFKGSLPVHSILKVKSLRRRFFCFFGFLYSSCPDSAFMFWFGCLLYKMRLIIFYLVLEKIFWDI